MKKYVKLYKFCDRIEQGLRNRVTWHEIKYKYYDLINSMSLTGTLLSSRSFFLQMDLCNEYMNRLLKIRLSWIAEQLIYLETGKSVEIVSAAIFTEYITGAPTSILFIDVLDENVGSLFDHGYYQIDTTNLNFMPTITKHNYTNTLYKTHTDWDELVSLNDVKEDILQFVTGTNLVEFDNVVIAIFDIIASACIEYGSIDINDYSVTRIRFSSLNERCSDAITSSLKKLAKDHGIKLRYIYVIISDFIMHDVRTVFGRIDYLYSVVDNIKDIFRREIAYYNILLSDNESEKFELIDEYYTEFGEPFTVWQADKDYVFDEEHIDSVVYNRNMYCCIESHKATKEFDHSKWKSISAGTVWKNIKNFK